MVLTQHEPHSLNPLQHGGMSSRCRARVCCIDDLDRVLDEVLDAMTALGYDERDLFGVRLALEEAITNGLKHGNRNNPERTVTVTWRVDADAVLAAIEDEGAGFDPVGVADPFSREGLTRLTGRGVLLMRYYVSWLRYNERGNRVVLCKYRTAS